MHDVNRIVKRHLLVGWGGLLIFLSLGIALEVMHGLKLQLYLNTQQEMRRLMWTLAHTHGTLFSLVHIAFALSIRQLVNLTDKKVVFPSAALIGAIVTMPLGFFLGGLWHYEGDPGLGIVLVPLGAFMLLAGVASFLVTLLSGELSAEETSTQSKEEKSVASKKRRKR